MRKYFTFHSFEGAEATSKIFKNKSWTYRLPLLHIFGNGKNYKHKSITQFM